MLNLVLFGPPGAGKGTQASFLIENYKLIHLSTGDILREEISNKSTLGLKAKKLMDRGTRIVSELTGLDYSNARKKLNMAENSVKSAIVMEKFDCDLDDAKVLLENVNGFLGRLINQNNEKTKSI